MLQEDFSRVADRFEMKWSTFRASRKKRLAIFVSKEDHCLLELLWQWQAGDLGRGYRDGHQQSSRYERARGIVRHSVPSYSGDSGYEGGSREAAAGSRDRQSGYIVLARYMQIISPKFIEQFPNRIINIHHSFLPAFVGGKPYAQAYQRGVKIIGATAHYVTEELDGGPIIEQDVQRVSHRDNVDDLKRIGRHIERVVLARAVKWHVEDRIMVHQNKTVVFN